MGVRRAHYDVDERKALNLHARRPRGCGFSSVATLEGVYLEL